MSDISRRHYILTQWDCLTFARDVLHIHVDARGRAPSLDGQHSSGNEALVITPEVWYDHKKHVGGGVIELCAWGMFGGDTGRAISYLAGDFFHYDASGYSRAIERVTRHVTDWHSRLRQQDRDYLHSRRINDDTIERLQLGFMHKTHDDKPEARLVIPYFDFDGKRILYYISRDRTGFEGVPKYKKCYLPRDSKGNDSETLFNIPWGLHTIHRKCSTQITLEDLDFNKDEWLVIAEGAFDAMSFEQEGWHVLSPMSGGFTDIEQRKVTAWARQFPKVLVIFDNDSAGNSFREKLAQEFFTHRVNFFVGHVPSTMPGVGSIKDVSDFYTAGGNLVDLALSAVHGLEYLAGSIMTQEGIRELLQKAARHAAKADIMELFLMVKQRKVFNPLWLKMIFDDAVKTPPETVLVREVSERHTLRYVENLGFHEYVHGVWRQVSDNRVKAYADDVLGRFSTNSKITSIMKFLQARLSTNEAMNAQPVINMLNGVLLPNENMRFVIHNPSYLSTIQIPFNYDSTAKCPLWLKFIADVTEHDKDKAMLLQEIGGYIFWPDNGLEKCFFLIGDGGNGKGVFMDTLRDVFGQDNCSALPLSSFGSQFDSIMLQHSLVNFASETRVDLRGNIERIKEVTSGNDIVAAHKGVDAIKFRPRCKLITSCNDFFNTGDITHALMRRMVFIQFRRNVVQMKKADIYLKDKLHTELPGILNWCIEGYLRLLSRAQNREADIFTSTKEDADQKREFMRTTNPVAFFIEERLMQLCDAERDTRSLYREFKLWADDAGYKPLSLGAFTNRIKRVMRELRPEVKAVERRCHTVMIFPAAQNGEEVIDNA